MPNIIGFHNEQIRNKKAGFLIEFIFHEEAQ